jgi:hypothetical protein
MSTGLPAETPERADRNVIVVSGPGGVGKSTIAHLAAGAFDRSVHLDADDFMASVVSGWIDPGLPAAEHQNTAIGGALAASAMGFAENGYAAVISGYLFPDGVAGLSAACRRRGISCHYAVLMADLGTCWERAVARGKGRWPLEVQPHSSVHTRFTQLDLDGRHVIDASRSPEAVSRALLSSFRAGSLICL